MNSLNRFTDSVYCIMRLIVGLTYACHGGQKLLWFPGGGHGAERVAFIAGIHELFFGFLIAFGFVTRIAALLARGAMSAPHFISYGRARPTPAANSFPI